MGWGGVGWGEGLINQEKTTTIVSPPRHGNNNSIAERQREQRLRCSLASNDIYYDPATPPLETPRTNKRETRYIRAKQVYTFISHLLHFFSHLGNFQLVVPWAFGVQTLYIKLYACIIIIGRRMTTAAIERRRMFVYEYYENARHNHYPTTCIRGWGGGGGRGG